MCERDKVTMIKPGSLPGSTYWDNRKGVVLMLSSDSSIAVVETTLKSGRKVKWIGSVHHLEGEIS